MKIRTTILALCVMLASAFALHAAEEADDAKAHDPSEPPRSGRSFGFRGSPGSSSFSRHRSSTEVLRDFLSVTGAEREQKLQEKLDRDRQYYEHKYADDLTLTPEQRATKVEDRIESWRTFWTTKIQEYEALPPEEREARLEITERTSRLRFSMKSVMQVGPEQRVEKMRFVRTSDRPLIEERLHEWDKLPKELQSEVLEHESVMSYFARLESTPAELRDNVLKGYSSRYREKLESDIKRWEALTPGQRSMMSEYFAKFFQLSEWEKERSLNALSLKDREQLERTLDQLEGLTPEKRKQCLDALGKYTRFTPEQRAQFDKNVERWNAMSESEKEAWRALVNKLPPLPPGARTPPLPPAPASKR